MFPHPLNHIKKNIALIIILILALFLRTYQLDWDEGYHFHPDERMIVMVADRLTWVNPITDWATFATPSSPMNPEFFAYGSFPIYLLAIIGHIVALCTENPLWSSYDRLQLVGRAISALADVGTAFFIYKIATRISHHKLGLWSASFYAIAVFPIQLSHFYAVDTLLTFFLTLSMFLLIKFIQIKRSRYFFLATIFAALAFTTKTSALFVAPAFVVALIFYIGKPTTSAKKRQVIKAFTIVLISLVIASIIVFITQPYMLFDLPTFARQIAEQSHMAKTAWMFPYTRQYLGTINYLYPLEQIAKWGLGWSIVLLSTVGLLSSIIYLIRFFTAKQKAYIDRLPLILILTFTTIYFLYFGQSAVKFMRYYFPLYPYLVIFAALGLQSVASAVRHYLPQFPGTTIIGSLTLASSFLWLISFISIYHTSNTRIQASQWIEQNIPSDTQFGIEAWDDAIPIPPWHQKFGSDFQTSLAFYDPDTPDKWHTLTKQLEEVDIIIIASNRVWAPLTRLDQFYPITDRYYHLLFTRQLGFEAIQIFNSPPRLGNHRIDDQQADESFYVYDHPEIIIFQKTSPMTAEQYFQKITATVPFQYQFPMHVDPPIWLEWIGEYSQPTD